jgi:hypothetical protein
MPKTQPGIPNSSARGHSAVACGGHEARCAGASTARPTGPKQRAPAASSAAAALPGAAHLPLLPLRPVQVPPALGVADVVEPPVRAPARLLRRLLLPACHLPLACGAPAIQCIKAAGPCGPGLAAGSSLLGALAAGAQQRTPLGRCGTRHPRATLAPPSRTPASQHPPDRLPSSPTAAQCRVVSSQGMLGWLQGEERAASSAPSSRAGAGSSSAAPLAA